MVGKKLQHVYISTMHKHRPDYRWYSYNSNHQNTSTFLYSKYGKYTSSLEKVTSLFTQIFTHIFIGKNDIINLLHEIVLIFRGWFPPECICINSWNILLIHIEYVNEIQGLRKSYLKIRLATSVMLSNPRLTANIGVVVLNETNRWSDFRSHFITMSSARHPLSYACHPHVIHQRAPTKQMLLYLPSKTKCGSQRKFKSKVDNDK